jgi:hypothetical protein
VQGRRAPGDPLEAGLGQLLQVLGAIKGTIGHKIHGAGGGLELRNVVADDLAERFAIVTIAPQGFHQHGDTGLVLHDQLQHPLVEVGAMVPPIALGDVHDLFVRSLSAVIPAINMETRRIEMAERGRQPQTLGRRGGNEAVECSQPSRVQRIEGASEGIIIEMTGLNTWGNEARDRLVLEKMGTR